MTQMLIKMWNVLL